MNGNKVTTEQKVEGNSLDMRFAIVRAIANRAEIRGFAVLV